MENGKKTEGFTITLKLPEINLAVNALAKLPYIESAQLINKLVAAVNPKDKKDSGDSKVENEAAEPAGVK